MSIKDQIKLAKGHLRNHIQSHCNVYGCKECPYKDYEKCTSQYMQENIWSLKDQDKQLDTST